MGYSRKAIITVRAQSNHNIASRLKNLHDYAKDKYELDADELPFDTNGRLLQELFNMNKMTDYGKMDLEGVLKGLSASNGGFVFSCVWIGEDGCVKVLHFLNGDGYAERLKIPTYSSSKLNKVKAEVKKRKRQKFLEGVARENAKAKALAKLSSEERKLLGL